MESEYCGMSASQEGLVRLILNRAYYDGLIQFTGKSETSDGFSSGDLAACARIVGEYKSLFDQLSDGQITAANWCWQQGRRLERFDLTETAGVFLRHLQSRVLAACVQGSDTLLIDPRFDCRILGHLIEPSFEEFQEIRRYLESQGFRFTSEPGDLIQWMTWSPEK